MLAAISGSAAAQVTIWTTATGAHNAGGQVSAEADFTRHSNGTLTVVLTNLGKNPIADSQEISGISFAVSGANGSGALTTNNSGMISTISSGGSYTAGVADPLVRWQAKETATTINLTALSGGKPDRLIIGPDNHGGFNPSLGSYGSANSSIIQHEPSVLGAASFTISVPGETNLSAISGVVFQFGTDAEAIPGMAVSSQGAAVPEPGFVSLFAAMGVTGGLVAFTRQRRCCK